MSDDLIAFIKARLDEDEAGTRELLDAAQYAKLAVREPRLLGREIPGWHSWPSVVAMCEQKLREIAAQRAILALHVPLDDCEPQQCVICLEYVPCRTLRHHAAVWSDHPGYSPEWKP